MAHHGIIAAQSASRNMLLATEVDPSNQIQNVTANSLNLVNFDRKQTQYLTFDDGAGYWNGNLIKMRAVITVTAASLGTWAAVAYPLTLSETVGNISGLGNHITVQLTPRVSNTNMLWYVRSGAVISPAYTDVGGQGQPRYMELELDKTVGTTGQVTLRVYADAGYSQLLFTQSIAPPNTLGAFRFCSPVVGRGLAGDPPEIMSAVISNFYAWQT